MHLSLLTTFTLLPLLFSVANAAPAANSQPSLTLVKRDRTPKDAEDPAKVVDWLKEVGFDDEEYVDKMVYYTAGGLSMANDFIDENFGYQNFISLYDDSFLKAFGLPQGNLAQAVADACSLAMAQISVGDTRVFKNSEAANDAVWTTIEMPELIANSAVTNIWSMDDDTVDENAHARGNLKFGTQGGPAPGNSYKPGWCTFHVAQYQRNENGIGADYAFSITMFDDAKNNIGGVAKAPIDANTKSLSVSSRLPLQLVITASGGDDDPVRFAYGAQSWDGSDEAHHCNLGQGPESGYENGKREGDCGFTC